MLLTLADAIAGLSVYNDTTTGIHIYEPITGPANPLFMVTGLDRPFMIIVY